ncbi:hypothetical protein ONZ45_g2921 [Pleurotus djamor]|nr:hypothetical protein ONZ45_g2921 [Pleurotus djamor]
MSSSCSTPTISACPSPKLESIVIQLRDFAVTMKAKDLPQLLTIFGNEAPPVESFNLLIEADDFESEKETINSFPTLPEDIFGGVRPPTLRRLSLSGCSISYKSPLLLGLTSLYLNMPTRPTSKDFIATMKNLGSLESLSLLHCLPLIESEAEDECGETMLSFPQLKELVLSDPLPNCIAFLELVDSTPTRVDITGDTEGDDCDSLFDHCSRLLGPRLRYFPFRELTLSSFPTTDNGADASFLHIRARSMDYSANFITKEDGEVSLSVRMAIPERMPYDIDAKASLKAAMERLPLQSIDVLDVDLHLQPDVYMDFLSPNLPNLRRLCCSQNSLVNFFLAYNDWLRLAFTFTWDHFPLVHLIPFRHLETIFGKLDRPRDLEPVIYPVLYSRRAVSCPIIFYNLGKIVIGSPRTMAMTL